MNKLLFAFSPYYEPSTLHQPKRGTVGAAGLDVWIPEFSERFSIEFEQMNPPADYRFATINKEKNCIEIPPHGRVLIPSGLFFNIPEGTYLEVANRGSVAAKLGLIYGAHIIDSDYCGEVFINLHNLSEESVRIDFGQKIAQLLHKEVIMSELDCLDFIDLYPKKTDRGAGKLGSTDNG